jgi:hypothetical protein
MQRRLSELGIDLSCVIAGSARGNYVFATKTTPGTKIIHLAGHIPFCEDGKPLEGVIGDESRETLLGKVFSVSEGYLIAQRVGLSLLKSLSVELNGRLERIQKILKINGLLRCESAAFSQHPQVIDGVSDLMVEVFGEERGKHARAAFGVHSLPSRVPLEIDMIVEVQEEEVPN